MDTPMVTLAMPYITQTFTSLVDASVSLKYFGVMIMVSYAICYCKVALDD